MAALIEQVDLPGVGTRSVFTTHTGIDIGVLAHHSGDREILVYGEDDPDRCSQMMRLDSGEAQALADLLGTATARTGGRVNIGGLVLEPVEILTGWWCIDRTTDRLPASAHAGPVIRDGAVLNPAVAGELRAGDTVILTGVDSEVQDTRRCLESGP